VISINIIFWIDRTITIGIIISNDEIGFFFNLWTSPSTFTGRFTPTVITVDISVRWTMFRSPIVFNHYNTFMDFTGTEFSISVEITHRIEFS
jgi:hypothetical protein